jgi:hypothetical protein
MLAPADSGLWATATAQWITLGGLLVSLVSTAFAWGKWAQKTNAIKEDIEKDFTNHKESVKNQLDGFGGRVESMESEHDHINGRLEEASGHVQRILGQHDSILGLLGEARGSSVQCREDTQALGEKLEKKLENITSQQADTKLHLSERLKGVEKELELMRRGDRT